MATSPSDPRITAAINAAMAWMKTQTNKATGDTIWRIAYPQWVGSGYHWCGGFPVAAYKLQGIDLMKNAWWFYTPYIKTFAKRIGAYKTSGQKYGDQPLYDWEGDGVIDHVGNAWPDVQSANFRNIEGNTSPGNAGSQSAGGGCYVRYRQRSVIDGWVDMRKVLAHMIDKGLWDGKLKQSSSTAKNPKPKKPAKLIVDNWWGRKTTEALQYLYKTVVDGEIWDQPLYHRFPNFTGGWKWVSKPSVGSPLIKAMQAELKEAKFYKGKVDGLAGPQFRQALRTKYKCNYTATAIRYLQADINKRLGY